MLEPLGPEAMTALRDYVARHHDENIMLMHDIVHRLDQPGTLDALTLAGLALDGEVVAVQGHYASGRWFPHFTDERATPALLVDARQLQPRWVMGVARVVDPIIDGLVPEGAKLSYDERDHVCDVDVERLSAVEPVSARLATPEDVPSLAELRRQFDAEYFGTDPRRISTAWCERVATNYVRLGAALAIQHGRVVAMVATEALLPQLAQIAGVYTIPSYRNRGLAHEVVSVLCQHHLATRPRVTLNVRKDNLVAYRIYRSLGFAPCGSYRMARLR